MGFFKPKLPEEYTTKLAKEATEKYGLKADLKEQWFSNPESRKETRQRSIEARRQRKNTK